MAMVTFRTTKSSYLSLRARTNEDPESLAARVARLLVSPFSLESTLEFVVTFLGTSFSFLEPTYGTVFVSPGSVPSRRHSFVIDLASKTLVVYGPVVRRVYGPNFRHAATVWMYDTLTLAFADFAALFDIPILVDVVPEPNTVWVGESSHFDRRRVPGCVTFRTTALRKEGVRFDAYAWQDGGRRVFGARVAEFLLGPQTLDVALEFLSSGSHREYERTYKNRIRVALVPDPRCCYDVDLASKTVVVTPELREGDETLTLTYEEFATWTAAD